MTIFIPWSKECLLAHSLQTFLMALSKTFLMALSKSFLMALSMKFFIVQDVVTEESTVGHFWHLGHFSHGSIKDCYCSVHWERGWDAS